VHHRSQDYNLSTALRQPSSYPFLNWIHVGQLGWFDRWFCSPSNHRVHHAVNDVYLDRNYGGMLVLWDRLFGSFREEGEKCVYGTRSPLESWDPLWANLEGYCAMGRDSWHARSWRDKLRVWFMPPGRRPVDVAERFPKQPFAIEKVTRFGGRDRRGGVRLTSGFACGLTPTYRKARVP
jgi:hypothetical protein